ncbi:polysaccharide biosynthesis/export family protein [Qipengyuania sp. JC766]|uniref:polysaccharide biosynthesis/export family protein n=1 Tax=Qipengyuania sp. JC766 TaxID=3232139 RepID=UPI00345B3080
MLNAKSLILLAGIVFQLSACASPQFKDYEVPAPTAEFNAENRSAAEELLARPYPLTVGDKVEVRVYRAPDLSGDHRIDGDGSISLPLIGEVPAAGLSPSDLARNLEYRYGQRYLENPSINVQVTETVRREFSVEGAVRRPGMFTSQPTLTLLDAVALAGGADPETATRKVVVLRRSGGESYVAGFDLTQMQLGQQPNPFVRPGDVVILEGSGPGLDTLDFVRFVPILALFTRL